MKTIRYYLLVLCLIVIECNAQTMFRSEQLHGTTWVPVVQQTSVCFDTISYTKSHVITKAYFPGLKKSATAKNYYYFDTTKPSEFDFTKVGKKTKGNFLVRYNDKMKEIYATRIKELDITKGVLIFEHYHCLTGCLVPIEYRLIKK